MRQTRAPWRTEQRLMVLDSASMYFRAFFGVPGGARPRRHAGERGARVARLHQPAGRPTTGRPTWSALGQRLAAAVARRPDPDLQGAPRRRRAARPEAGHRGGARPARAAGADHPRGARRVRDLRGRRGRLRGRRRDRHARDRRRDAGRRRHRRPRPVPAGRRPGRRPGALHRPRRRQPRAGDRRGRGREVRRPAQPVRRLRHHARRRLRRAARGARGSARRRRPRCCWRTATSTGIIAAAADPASEMSPGPRRKILDAADYLEVAPTVVAVARDIDLAAYDATLPVGPARPRAGRRPSPSATGSAVLRRG